MLLLAGTLLLASAGPASAAACWKALLNDWYDGTIDKVYAIPCYNQAVDHLPTDVANYSSARDDILRALQQVIAAQNQETTTTEATETTDTSTGSSATPPPTDTNPTTTTPTTTSPGREEPKGIRRAIVKVTPGNADSFPLPLLILGALAILLVLAGVAGMLWRRSQEGGGAGVT
jgi:hypothetical protein